MKIYRDEKTQGLQGIVLFIAELFLDLHQDVKVVKWNEKDEKV